MIKLTKKQAREFLVNYHNINTSSKMSIDDVFNRINTIQYDPLSVVGTNPELVLQSRVVGFKRKHLDNELYRKRTLIDGWDKQMSIYQTKYFSEYKTIRDHRANSTVTGYKKYFNLDPLEFHDEVLEIVKEKGPILSSKIKLGESIKQTWGHNKPSSATLDYLFHKGEIGVHSRNHRQKKYDIINKLIPYKNTFVFNTEEDFTEWYLLRRIEALGIFSNKNSVHSYGVTISKKNVRARYIKQLIKKGFVEELKIEGLDEIFYIPSKAKDIEIRLKDKISFIAPLDNLIWDRNLVKNLFDFEYTWEVYTPKSKRKYGYYVLPILRREKLIGRIEFKPYKNGEKLEIINLFLEKGIKKSNLLEQKLSSAYKRLTTYLS